MSARIRNRSFRLGSLTLLVVGWLVIPSTSWGQGGFVDPFDRLSAGANAQAETIRALGEASVDFAEAEKVHQEAVAIKLENSVRAVETYWERKAIGERNRRARAYNHLESKKRRNQKMWERLRDHPDLSGLAITDGRALNFLLQRLSVTVLSYDFSLGQDPKFPDEMLAQLALDSDSIHSLNLRQNVGRGQIQVFRADSGVGLDTEWWPFALRGIEYKRERDAFETARTEAVLEGQQSKTLSNETVMELHRALLDIEIKFQEQYNKKNRTAKLEGGSRMETWQQYKTADSFLTQLAREISRLKQTGKSSMFDGSLKFEGDHLIALLTYMTHNGLDFAPAPKGEEQAYFTLYRMMRDLYITSADTDTGLAQPVPVEDAE